jgi:hypothetical protein
LHCMETKGYYLLRRRRQTNIFCGNTMTKSQSNIGFR